MKCPPIIGRTHRSECPSSLRVITIIVVDASHVYVSLFCASADPGRPEQDKQTNLRTFQLVFLQQYYLETNIHKTHTAQETVCRYRRHCRRCDCCLRLSVPHSTPGHHQHASSPMRCTFLTLSYTCLCLSILYYTYQLRVHQTEKKQFSTSKQSPDLGWRSTVICAGIRLGGQMGPQISVGKLGITREIAKKKKKHSIEVIH